MRHEDGSSAAQEQLSKLEAACKRLLLAPIDHSRALQDIMQDERAEFVDRAKGLEIRTVSVIEPRTTIKGGKCLTRRCFRACVCPCSTSGGGFDLRATGLLRSSHSCWTSGLTIILVSPKVLHPEHASYCAAYIGKVENHTQQDLGGCDGRALLLRSWTRQRLRQGRCSNTWSLRAHAPWILDFFRNKR